jgi:hypothetical protein
MLSLNSTSFKKSHVCVCTHAHTSLGHVPKKQFVSVTSGQALLHHKTAWLKTQEDRLLFWRRITGVCLRFINPNPIVAVSLDHYGHVTKTWWVHLFCRNYLSFAFCNPLASIGKTKLFQHEWPFINQQKTKGSAHRCSDYGILLQTCLSCFFLHPSPDK